MHIPHSSRILDTPLVRILPCADSTSLPSPLHNPGFCAYVAPKREQHATIPGTALNLGGCGTSYISHILATIHSAPSSFLHQNFSIHVSKACSHVQHTHTYLHARLSQRLESAARQGSLFISSQKHVLTTHIRISAASKQEAKFPFTSTHFNMYIAGRKLCSPFSGFWLC